MGGKLIPIVEYAKKHGVVPTAVRQKCQRGNIPGAIKIGRNWCVPEDAPYEDHRISNGRYVKARKSKKDFER